MEKQIHTILDIKYVLYINLEYRVDRKQHVEKQLNNIGISSFERFNAIKLSNGRLGCSLSHLKCLELAKASGWDHILIVEDDILFLNPTLFQQQLGTFLSNHKEWDVLLIGGNVVPPYQPIDSCCIKVSKCQTTTGYLVRSHYYDSLIENIRTGMTHLLNEHENHNSYALDKYWFHLQQKHLWYLIIPLTVTQREDYSDIEKRPTNYTRVMTDLEKPWLQR
jgi:GR25 family glycosyltransferase involved in LPS biosynthesis